MPLTTFHNIFDTYIPEENQYYSDDGLLMYKPLLNSKSKFSGKPKTGIPGNIDYQKNKTFLREVIFKYHPAYNDLTAKTVVENLDPDHLNIERMVEESIAITGGYNFINDNGRDFDDVDNSDSKTTSLNANTGIAEFSNLRSKVGSLRISVYNPFTQTIDFFYMRYEDWQDKAIPVSSKNNIGDFRLKITYSTSGMHYNQFEEFRVKDFVELATKMDPQNLLNTSLQDQDSQT